MHRESQMIPQSFSYEITTYSSVKSIILMLSPFAVVFSSSPFERYQCTYENNCVFFIYNQQSSQYALNELKAMVDA